jgi:anaerobic ribonucleoside-triphosphate reductase activating protein
MKIKGIVFEDFLNYKKPSLFIIFPYCNFKCDKDCGLKVCQNSSLVKEKEIEYSIDKIVNNYIENDITKAIVCGGLEPMDSFDDLKELVGALRIKTNDDIVIYTGYREEEIEDKANDLKQFANIIIKFGRYIPNDKEYYNDILGINLASRNQYAKKIS